MLKNDIRCSNCARIIPSYKKRVVDFTKNKYKCPFCSKWHELELEKYKK